MSIKQLVIIWAARYEYQPGWSSNQHYQPYFQLIYIQQGEGEICYQDQQFKALTGNMYLIVPGEKYNLKTSENILQTIDLKFKILNQELANKIKNVGRKFKEFTQQEYLLNRILQTVKNKDNYSQQISETVLLQLLLEILKHNSAEQNNLDDVLIDLAADDQDEAADRVCKLFINYVKKNYQADLLLKTIASDLGFNQSYICQCFDKNYQLTPMNFLYKYRIEKAAELIKYSDYSLREISQLTGFKTIHHFNRTFSKYQGLPPGRYRKQYLAGLEAELTADILTAN
ncbi:helix-turn-helix domain-containing protein [Halanaerobium salsuginis]|uniref:AraC-like ligand binding domain-containing protein n=1 Tax=Halanaerobium salsuginis TaxID=29563 RepID=A0A1I4J748_9FIRM|nr:AraC family transcriptional regulator [Halanaerobium salsuginis]SFL62389.1 AraC-like ligand binding domain-containing protein [Halanaerobium salsuginis]